MSPRKKPSDTRQLTIDFEVNIPEDATVRPQPAPQTPTADPDPRIFFISFGSGSSGNASYIGTSQGGFIIDAGVKDDVIRDTLKGCGIPMSHVKGLCLTHDHSDHVRYAYALLRNNKHLALFCTHRVLNGMLRRHSISKRIKDFHRPIFKEIPFTLGGMEITAFDVPHDGSDNMGFSVSFDNRNFVIATDLGEVAGRALNYISQADYLVIEANYDARMLRDGPYPEYLKARIATDHGHMNNVHTARLLSAMVSGKPIPAAASFGPALEGLGTTVSAQLLKLPDLPANDRLKYVFLCHLSHDNNTPEKALEAVRGALEAAGKRIGDASMRLDQRDADIQLMALPRFDPSPLFIFRPSHSDK